MKSLKSPLVIGLIAFLVFTLAGVGTFAFLLYRDKTEAVPATVAFTVNAEGWDEETSSPIPLHVTGETVDKEKVDEKYFIGHSANDLSLKSGTYEVEVYASPVNADGGMYSAPEPVKLVIPTKAEASKEQSNASGMTANAEISLSPAPANEVTDEDIDNAQAAMKDAGLSETEINTFVDAARKARQAEIDRLDKERKAEKNRKEQEKKAKEREALGMYPGAGGARPANAQPWPAVKYGHAYVKLISDFASCYGDEDRGINCTNTNKARNYPLQPPADGDPNASPSQALCIGISHKGIEYWSRDDGPPTSDSFRDLPVGQAWYLGDYVLGRTSQGLTAWDTSSGHGFFITNDGSRTETF